MADHALCLRGQHVGVNVGGAWDKEMGHVILRVA
jgi:hypothetical protein